MPVAGVLRRKTTRTTVADPSAERFPDRIQRAWSQAQRPDQWWVADFTYVHTSCGFSYVAFVTDVFTREILAYVVDTRATKSLVIRALRQALALRQRQDPYFESAGVIHHLRSAQYTAVKFTDNLALQGITPSIGSVGDAYDNALMESINGLYKTECIGSRIFTPERLESIVEVELATMSWVQWYNNRRLHSTLGMLPPAEYEEAYWAGHATIIESSERVAQPI